MYILLHLTEAGMEMTFPYDKDLAEQMFDDLVGDMKRNKTADDEILHFFELPVLEYHEPIKVDQNGTIRGVDPIKSHNPFKWGHSVE